MGSAKDRFPPNWQLGTGATIQSLLVGVAADFSGRPLKLFHKKSHAVFLLGWSTTNFMLTCSQKALSLSLFLSLTHTLTHTLTHSLSLNPMLQKVCYIIRTNLK